MLARAFCALLVLAACVSCDRTHNITVEFYSEDGYRFSQAERDTIEDIADATIPEVRKILTRAAQRAAPEGVSRQ